MSKDDVDGLPALPELALLGVVLALSTIVSIAGIWRFITERSESIVPYVGGMVLTLGAAILLAHLIGVRRRILLKSALVAARLSHSASVLMTEKIDPRLEMKDVREKRVSEAVMLLHAVQAAGERTEALQLQQAILSFDDALRRHFGSSFDPGL